jgi:hypothetical protein
LLADDGRRRGTGTKGVNMTNEPSAVPATTPNPTGLWRNSRAIYVLGAPIVALLASLAVLVAMAPISGLALALVLLAAATIIVLAPLASWIAWPVAAPELSAPLRWLLLTMVTSLISVVVLAILLGALKVIDVWPWLAPPAAGVHALWTAIFLLGARR